MSEAFAINRTEVDGVPVFWTEVEGPRIASFMFRVGRADEPAHQGGITHLVEHLALAPLTQQHYSHNGFVAGLRTVFHASGSDEQLVEFVASVVASLGALPIERILMERRILAQEAASRGPNAGGMQRWFRHGFRGQGLLGAEEIGLEWLGPDPVTDWARTWFTKANAALWWSGEPPVGLRIELPDGERKPVAPSPVVPGVSFPAHTDLGGQGASMAFIAQRSAATRMTVDILARRIRQDLRFERGLIYDVAADYDPLGPDEAHVSIGMDCRREDGTEVARTVFSILEDLRDRGPDAEEVSREATAFAEGAQHPGGRLGFLDGSAHDELVGRRREEPAAIVDEYLSTTPADIQAVATTAFESLLVFAPPGYSDRVNVYPISSPTVVDGRTIRPSGWLIGPRARKDRLILGATGVSWVAPDGRANTVRFDECVALRHWDGPIRELWGADGFRVVVDASAWRGGQALVDAVDAAVDPAVIACGEHGIGGLESPPDSESRAAGSA